MKRLSLRKKILLGLFSKLRNQMVKEHELKVLFWECTLRCNLSCLHCGSDCKTESTVHDMPAADFFNVIDKLTPHVNPNKVMITFSGGEPLMRKDLEQCGLELYKRGYPWGMVTNGYSLDAKRFDSLLKAGLHSITVSLDGFAPEHNEIRGNKHSFDKALNAIRMIVKDKDIVYDVVTCVNQHNLSTLEEFKNFLIKEGVKHWRLFTIFPAGRATQYDFLHLSNEQTIQLLDFIKKTRKEKNIHIYFSCDGFLGSYEAEVRDHFYFCAAGINIASIRINGDISGCTSIRHNFTQGNIYQDRFWEVWNNKFVEFRNRNWAKEGVCATCKAFKHCHGGGMHLRGDNKEMLDCTYLKLE